MSRMSSIVAPTALAPLCALLRVCWPVAARSAEIAATRSTSSAMRCASAEAVRSCTAWSSAPRAMPSIALSNWRTIVFEVSAAPERSPEPWASSRTARPTPPTISAEREAARSSPRAWSPSSRADAWSASTISRRFSVIRATAWPSRSSGPAGATERVRSPSAIAPATSATARW